MTTNEVQVGRTEYLSAAETAKLVRKALARAFPGYDFSVRSHSYANGASVYVDWHDGPPAPVVDRVVRRFAGGGFDGMIDMAYSVESWLDADGNAYVAGSPGTSGSGGVYEPIVTDAPSADARLVHFGADHVLTQRYLTPEADAVIDRKVAEKYGAGYDDRGGMERVRVANRWLFPPTTFTYEVVRGFSPETRVVEASGLTSKSAAEKVARENQKARAGGVRGYRCVTAHRGGTK